MRRRKQELEISDMAAEDERSKLENEEYRVSWLSGLYSCFGFVARVSLGTHFIRL